MNATARRPDDSFFDHAACKGKHRLFWPRVGEVPIQRSHREARALALCRECPVMDACRTWARQHGEPGIWGGETEVERAAAGFAPSIPGLHIDRDVRRATARSLAAQFSELSLEQLEAIANIANGDPTCS